MRILGEERWNVAELRTLLGIVSSDQFRKRELQNDDLTQAPAGLKQASLK